MSKNKLSINSKYKSKISFDDFLSANDVLVSYYLPIIKPEAYSLYSALLIDSRNSMINTVYVSIERLISMINLSLEKIEDSISRLEIVNLIEVYSDENDNFIFKLNKPLSPIDFNNSEQFIELLKSCAGDENLKINNKLFNSLKDFDSTNLNENTKKVNISPNFNDAKLNVEYDFDSIKNILNAKNIDWSAYWTEDLESILLNTIVLYQINSFDISIELIKEIETGNFNINNVIDRIRKDYSKNNNIKSIISKGDKTTEIKLDFLSQLKVKDYLIHRLERAPSPLEEKLISKLFKSYKFSDYQINILLDYSIIVNDGIINEKYVLKIADTIIKNKIDTPEKLIQHLKNSYKLKIKKSENNELNNKLLDEKPIF